MQNMSGIKYAQKVSLKINIMWTNTYENNYFNMHSILSEKNNCKTIF